MSSRHGGGPRHDHSRVRLRRTARRRWDRTRRRHGLFLRDQLLKRKLHIDDSLDVSPVHESAASSAPCSPAYSPRHGSAAPAVHGSDHVGAQLGVQALGVVAAARGARADVVILKSWTSYSDCACRRKRRQKVSISGHGERGTLRRNETVIPVHDARWRSRRR